MPSLDCIIIGTGFSALGASRQLTQAGLKVLHLEGRSRVGGRAVTLTEGVDSPIDLGCAQIHGYREGNPMRKVSEALGVKAHVPEGVPPPLVYAAEGLLTTEITGELFATSAAQAYKPTVPPPSPISSIASVLPTAVTSSPSLLSLSRTAEIGSGIPLEEISAKWWNFGKAFVGTDGAPVGGYKEIIGGLVSEVEGKGAKVELGKEVVGLEDLGAEGVKVVVKGGEEYTAKTVISTIPLGVLKLAPPKFTPALSPSFSAALERTSNGSLEKIILFYESAWWPSSDTQGVYLLLPTTLRNADDPATNLHDVFAQTVLPVNNMNKLAQKPHPSLLIYVGAKAAEFLASYSESEIGDAMHEYLLKRFEVAEEKASKPKRVVVTRWLADPFSRGETSAPVSLVKSKDGELGTPLDYVTLGREQWDGRLGFAGEHTVIDGRGSVAGAWLSGEREGQRVVALLGKGEL
ncbi:flavin containing amine oxidase [Pseudohyphozyma bogoriensis]|nr:flavin containing amine oxidase [Pseudohyphozyma bogoriensis]